MNPPSATPKDSITFKNQHKLPRLPVPELDVTLSKLIQSCQPLAENEQEFNALKDKVQQFKDGLGPELQRRLQAKREEP
jgi:carnitine O-acetyltransferase